VPRVVVSSLNPVGSMPAGWQAWAPSRSAHWPRTTTGGSATPTRRQQFDLVGR